MGVDTGRATTRAHPPHPLPARPYYTANRPAKAVYSRGRGGCGRGDGALVAARACPPYLFSSFGMYCPQRMPLHFVASLYRSYLDTCPPDRVPARDATT